MVVAYFLGLWCRALERQTVTITLCNMTRIYIGGIIRGAVFVTKRMTPHTTVLMLIQMIKNFMAERLFKAMTAMIPHNTMAMKTDNKNTMLENLP